MAQSTDPMSIYSDGQRRTAPPPGLQSGDSKDGPENVSMFRKVKNKGKKLRDKVKAQYSHPSDDKEEEEETVEDEDHGKPNENVDAVTTGMAGLGGLGAANKDDRAHKGSEKANKTTMADILGKKNDGMSAEETIKESKGPDDELHHKDSILTDSKESPQEAFSSFEESGQDENKDDVTNGMAGIGGLGTVNKDDRADQGSEKVNKNKLGDILGEKNDGMSVEETRKESEGPDDEFRHKDSILTDSKENPQEGLSSFKGSRQGRSNRGDDIHTTQKEEIGTDVGTPYRAAHAMPGAAAGIIGLGKGNREEEDGEEKPNSTKFDEPPLGLKEEPNSTKFDEPPLGLKEVPKPLEEEFQIFPEKSNKDPQSDVGEGNDLSSNEKPIEEVESTAPVDTKKAGLIQGLKDSLTSDQGKKDDIVAEEQSRENQDKEMQSEGEEKGGQSYYAKLFAAKNVIATKLGYGALPVEEKAPVEESRGEDKSQGHKTEEKPTEEAEYGASVDTKPDHPGTES